MILFDRKKALNQILGDPTEKKAESPKVGGAEAIAKEAVDAVHAKDHKGFADAMKAMHMFHQGEMDPDGDGDKHSPITGKEE